MEWEKVTDDQKKILIGKVTCHPIQRRYCSLIAPFAPNRSGPTKGSQSFKGTRTAGQLMRLQKVLPVGNEKWPTVAGTQSLPKSMHRTPPTLRRETQKHPGADGIRFRNRSAPRVRVRWSNAPGNLHKMPAPPPRSIQPMTTLAFTPGIKPPSLTLHLALVQIKSQTVCNIVLCVHTSDVAVGYSTHDAHFTGRGVTHVSFIPTFISTFKRQHIYQRWRPTELGSTRVLCQRTFRVCQRHWRGSRPTTECRF